MPNMKNLNKTLWNGLKADKVEHLDYEITKGIVTLSGKIIFISRVTYDRPRYLEPSTRSRTIFGMQLDM